MLTRCKNY